MKTRFFAVPLAVSFALTGCMDTTQLGDPNSKAQQGAIVGAMLGGIAGLSSDKNKGAKAVVGAAIGGAIGGTIGQQLDRQADDLRQDFGNDEVQIVNTGSELIVTMPQDILFAIDSAVVVPSLQSDLGALAQNLIAYPDTSIQVVGHTDNSGTAEHNFALSTRRAAAVGAILTANGVASGRIQAYGRGEDMPVTTNLTPEGRAQNRRVEIIITPTT